MLQGLEINGAFVDQAEEISEKTWDMIDARVSRWTKLPTMPPRYLFATANPTDELHWLYERFADESPRRDYWEANGYQCRVVDSRSNRFLPQENLDALLGKDEEFIRRYVRGEWGNPEGRIFTVDPLSYLEPTPELLAKIQASMNLHRSLDHASVWRTVCCAPFGREQLGARGFVRPANPAPEIDFVARHRAVNAPKLLLGIWQSA